MTTDQFAERFAAVRERFAAKLDSRIDEIEAGLPLLGNPDERETLARVHRRAHDLCGIGPTMGFVETGKTARTVERTLLAPLRANRMLNADEIAKLRGEIAALRAAAHTETKSSVPE